MNPRALTFEEALKMAERYCAYQERCTSQTENYLKKHGLAHNRIADVIELLKQYKFIDDQRFACAWVRGKFRNNGWGPIRLAIGLKRFAIDAETIQIALNEIDDEQYRNGLEHMLRKKLATSAYINLPEYIQRAKVLAWTYAKGYDTELTKDVLNLIKRDNPDINRDYE
jgi:regulatory protein